MGYGTYCKAELYFSHKTYKYKEDVEEDIEDVKNNIAMLETKFAMYAASEPRKALACNDCEGAEINPVDVLYIELRDLKEWYKELIIEKWRLETLLENFDTRTGDFIDEDKLREELTNPSSINN